MPDVQSTEPAADTVAKFPPVPAARVAHPTYMPREGRNEEEWPFQWWRIVMLGVAVGIGAACGPAAADPIVNTADLGVIVALIVLVLAVILPNRRRDDEAVDQ